MLYYTIHDLDTRETGAEVVQLHVLPPASKAVEQYIDCCRAETIACICINNNTFIAWWSIDPIIRIRLIKIILKFTKASDCLTDFIPLQSARTITVKLEEHSLQKEIKREDRISNLKATYIVYITSYTCLP